MIDPQISACPGCGVKLPTATLRIHVCDWWRWLDHQVDLRRDELNRFEGELGAYLTSAHGKFEVWYAERARQGLT